MSLKTLRNVILIASIVCSLTITTLAREGAVEEVEKKVETDTTLIPGDTILAKLGDSTLTMQQVRWLTPTDDLGTLKRIVKAWIETELLYLEATKEKIDETPKTQFRAQLRVKQSYAAELIKIEQDKAKLTIEEMREHYDQYKYSDPMMSTPVYYSFAHIRCISEEKANDVLKRVKSGDDFSKIAAHESVYSEDKVRGGRVSRMKVSAVKGNFGELFTAELEKAKDKEFFGPVMSLNGLWEVGRRDSMIPQTAMSFEEVVKKVKPRIERADRMGAMLLLKHNLKEKYKDIMYRSPLIQYDEEKAKAEKAKAEKAEAEEEAKAPELLLDD